MRVGTRLVKDIHPGANAQGAYWLTGFQGTLFFTINDGLHGYELWKSDGTRGGTSMVKDIRVGPQGSLPFYLTSVGGILYFSADDGKHGQALWKSDGLDEGPSRSTTSPRVCSPLTQLGSSTSVGSCCWAPPTVLMAESSAERRHEGR